jgi:pimeloyl-ACP methyl ester carboxylesterase
VTTRLLAATGLLIAGLALADGPSDNIPEKVRRIPPAGVAVPDAVRTELRTGCDDLAREIDGLRKALVANPDMLALLPDVEIYHKAVDWALRYDEFMDAKDFPVARKMLATGRERAKQLGESKPVWTTQTGLVVRGYRSKIDGSVQPYGLVIPASYQPNGSTKHRLDLWWHGRGETLTELKFIADREKNPGQFTQPDTIVLHPYGRYCNANRFAGEVDTFEAMEQVKKHYRIDEDRIVARGFSMGGAACWQFATHFPSTWCAAAPGAGFSETADFLKVFQNEQLQPTEWEKKLWHWYDSTDYARNLLYLPTVAYSGEIDRQKQAADMMAKALRADGMELTHLIGPKTAHAYHPETKKEINRRLDAIVARKTPWIPFEIRFTTWTLRYPRCHWIHIDGLERHWERAIVDANMMRIETSNISALTLSFPPGQSTVTPYFGRLWSIDDTTIDGGLLQSDRSLTIHLRKANGRWQKVDSPGLPGLAKRHGLQGPIDDAFMDRFLMVRPTGKPLNDKVGAWAKSEMNHATTQWRQQFRGDAPIKDDTAVNDADIASSNLVLWGDPSSNAVLAKIADKLPVKWSADGVRVGDKKYAADSHVPLLIYPNPLNPHYYVVLNSGFTYREYDYLNNARQTPKLPDWAIVDVTTPPSSKWPGKVVAADFFDEEWKVGGASK